jgi:hypothetical protein
MAELQQVTPPRLHRLVQQRVAEPGRPGHREGDRDGPTRGDQGARPGSRRSVDDVLLPNDAMTRRFASGHRREEDGTVGSFGRGRWRAAAIRWAGWRRRRPTSCAGRGSISTIGRTRRGHRRSSEDLIRADAGADDRDGRIRPRRRDRDLLAAGTYGGEKMVRHGGATLGQLSGFAMIPARRFAIASLTNSEPNGPAVQSAHPDWAFEHLPRPDEPDPVPEPRPPKPLPTTSAATRTSPPS